MWTTFKVFIEFVTILLLFMFWFFGHKSFEILAPWPGIKPSTPVSESEVLTIFLYQTVEGFVHQKNRQRTTLSGGIYVPNHLTHLCYGYTRAPGAGGWWRNNHKCDSVLRFPWKSQCETLSKKQCLGRSSVKAHLQYSKWNPYSSILKDDLQ